MEFRTIGKNGPKVSRSGMGVWQASDLWKGDDEQIVRAITRGHELGVNLVDTAEAYGNGHSEQVVGRALRDRPGRSGSATLLSETLKRPDPTCPGPTSSQIKSDTTSYNEKSKRKSY